MEKENDTEKTAITSNAVLPAVFLTEYNGEEETKIMWDRTRTVNYNGEELQMNSYSCSSCKEDYKFEEVNHNFCPFCGTKYKYQSDLSV